MGDSFASGPLVSPMVSVLCARSGRNYAHQIADRLAVDELRDVSCAGATTSDVSEPQTGLIAPQLEALDEHTHVVTVSMGGNDIGFGGYVIDCFRPLGVTPPCVDTLTAGGVDQISESIQSADADLDAMYAAIQAAAPNAAIYAIGYPALLPADGSHCWPLEPILPADAPYLRDKLIELNGKIEERAEVAGIEYVDLYTPSIGHDPCQPAGVAWVEGYYPDSTASPVHPNGIGYDNFSDIIGDRIVADGH